MSHLKSKTRGGRILVKWLLAGCGGLVGLLVLAGIFIWLLLHASPTVPPEVARALESSRETTPASTGTSVPATGTSSLPSGTSTSQTGTQALPPKANVSPAPPVEHQVQQIERATRQGYRGPVRLVISQAELNHYFAGQLGPNVRQAEFAILQGKVVAVATVVFGQGQVKAYVEAQPQVEDGMPRLVITKATIGRLPVPADKLAKLQQQLDRAVVRRLSEAKGVQVTSFRAEPGLLILEANITSGAR